MKHNKKGIIQFGIIAIAIAIVIVVFLVYSHYNKPILPQIRQIPKEISCEEKYDLRCLSLTRGGIEKCYTNFPSTPDGSHIPFKTAEAVCEGIFPGFPQYKCFVQGNDGIMRVYFSQSELNQCTKK